MIKNSKKIPVLRYGLIVLLVTILFSGAFYLYMRYDSARQLRYKIGKLLTARANSDIVDSCLLNLYSADNNSRLYAITGDKKYANLFSAQLSKLSTQLAEIKFDDNKIPALKADRLNGLISQKKEKTSNYIRLTSLTDSLIKSTLKIDSMLSYTPAKQSAPVIRTTKTIVHIDTIKPAVVTVTTPKKRKFFGRIFSAISGKNKKAEQVTTNAPVIVKRDTLTKTIVQSGITYNAIAKKTYRNHHKLNIANTDLRKDERDILLINNNLIIDIVSELNKYKALEIKYAADSKAELADKVSSVFKEYNYLSKFTIVALILLLIAVFYNIWKIFNNEVAIIAHSEKAEQYANNKSMFMASMSHEIRTPLNSVIGFSEQLASGKLNPDQTLQINAIRSSSQMLLEVVNEILDFSKYETGKMTFEQQPFMLNNVLNDVLNAVEIQAAKKGLILKQDILLDEDLCISGDMLRLKQVVMNLLVNAIKFTPKGQVLLQAKLMHKRHDKAVLKVRIKDTGIGIKKHDLPTIFDEFSQVDEAQKVTRHKGTGLGLAICKKIIELQGGRIKVISELNKGSVFSFELPVTIADKADCVEAQQISTEDLANLVTGAHVLLVEDNELNVLLAKTILKKWKITCDIAYNGQEAFNLFEEYTYDLVLTDIQMPVMGGLELLSLIRQSPNSLKAEMPVIAFTANVLKEARDAYFKAGIDDIVLKPFNERDLIEKISQGLKNKYTQTDKFLSQNTTNGDVLEG
ncbi:ATP-binding protein [Mucilaginibacter jinjuensis]|uniref:histidine kinase n=1 Tax=Mucilaginibacter jinjuensis TaxID=1176721 RepID=A0ABY7T5H5_9SPHI|nr:ATP-binding protein [Mucilaginibacter jinjuensis]WCT11425.1 ATP-binding protein [Mucilaginibacter jinjuensis]